jgi:hypothetical protein
MVQLHKIMIGILFSVIITLGITLYFTDGIITYSPTGSDNVSVINASMNQRFNELSGNTTEMKNNMETLTSTDSSILDRLGAFFASGYDSLKLGAKSFNILNSMVDTSTDQLSTGGSFIKTIKNMLPVAILIVLFIAIVLNALIKTERI